MSIPNQSTIINVQRVRPGLLNYILIHYTDEKNQKHVHDGFALTNRGTCNNNSNQTFSKKNLHF